MRRGTIDSFIRSWCHYHRQTMVGLARSLAVALLVAACSTSSAPAGPSAAPSAGLASVAPSPGPESTRPSAPLRPLDGLRLYVQDPAVEITLPEGWRYRSPEEIKNDLAARPEEDSDREARARFEEKLSSGRLRMAAEGLTPRGIQVGFEVTVEDFESTALAIDAFANELELSGEVDTVETGTIDTPIGPATWLRFAMQLPEEPGYAPSQVVAYLIPVDGDQMLIIDSVGRQEDPTHRPLMDQIIGNVRRPTISPIPAEPGARLGTTPGTPTIGFEYPERYLLWPIDAYRTALEERLPDLEGDMYDDTKRAIEDIDKGIVRLVLIEQRVVVEVTGVIFASVEDTAEDPDATADRMFARLDLPPGRETREVVALPVGAAIRLEAQADDPAGRLIRHILYVVRLDDGKTLAFSASAEDSDGTLSEVMDRLTESVTVSWTRSA